MPVAARRLLNDLPDDLRTKINIEFHRDPADGVFKALMERATGILGGSDERDANGAPPIRQPPPCSLWIHG